MAKTKMSHQDLAVTVMKYIQINDVICAKLLLVSIDEEDRKMIVGHFEKPLWVAARYGDLRVVKLLQEYGTNINAVSENGRTPVNVACVYRQLETAMFLVRKGADVNIPDDRGETCLMNSVYHWELCQLLIDNGARPDAKDNLGNTALHHAIAMDNLNTVQLLLERGSNQNIANNQDNDPLQLASLLGKESIVMQLVASQEPLPLRWIESQQLLGSYCLIFSEARNVNKALVFWKRSVAFRMAKFCKDSRNIESSRACLVTKEVNTVEELEKLCQDEEKVYFYALDNLIRIIGPCRQVTTDGLSRVCNFFVRNGKYRRALNLLKYTSKFWPWNAEYFPLLELIHGTCWHAVNQSQIGINFKDVIEILDMVTLKAKSADEGCIGYTLFCKEKILSLVRIAINLVERPDQMISLKRVVHRLVHSQIKIKDDWTFLHRAVEECCLFQGGLNVTVVEVLLECGADVNALDRGNNTALHVCTQLMSRFRVPNMTIMAQIEEVIELLLRYSAHVDLVNDSGDIAAKGLQLNKLNHVNLQCLAAAFILDRQIPYLGNIPASLEWFVQMHSRRF